MRARKRASSPPSPPAIATTVFDAPGKYWQVTSRRRGGKPQRERRKPKFFGLRRERREQSVPLAARADGGGKRRAPAKGGAKAETTRKPVAPPVTTDAASSPTETQRLPLKKRARAADVIVNIPMSKLPREVVRIVRAQAGRAHRHVRILRSALPEEVAIRFVLRPPPMVWVEADEAAEDRADVGPQLVAEVAEKAPLAFRRPPPLHCAPVSTATADAARYWDVDDDAECAEEAEGPLAKPPPALHYSGTHHAHCAWTVSSSERAALTIAAIAYTRELLSAANGAPRVGTANSTSRPGSAAFGTGRSSALSSASSSPIFDWDDLL
jgi:hypothetical protein